MAHEQRNGLKYQARFTGSAGRFRPVGDDRRKASLKFEIGNQPMQLIGHL